MVDLDQRISELDAEIQRLNAEREAIIQPYDEQIHALQQQRKQLITEDALQHFDGIHLQVGDHLIVTQAFWDEKERRRVAGHFSGMVFQLGSEVIVDEVYGDRDQLSVMIADGGSSTGVEYATALNMREAWVKANA